MNKNTTPLIITVLVRTLFSALCVAGRQVRDDASARSGPITADVQADDLSSITPPDMVISGPRRSLSASIGGWRDGGGRVAWNYNCDFNGPVYSDIRMPPELCGPTCDLENNPCTHFVHRDGICFLKTYFQMPGSVLGPGYPMTWNVPNRICGFIVLTPEGKAGR